MGRDLHMVKKSDWKTVDMPEEVEHFNMEMKLTADMLENLKEGHRPEEMEDKWFMYFENDKFYIHRSWTGFCIYIISPVLDSNVMEVTVNRNKEQHTETRAERDKIMVNMLLNAWGKQNANTRELMLRWVKQPKKS